jgi:hypothetical protein
MFYGIYNAHADLSRYNHGFANTWAVVRFASKAEREEFLLEYSDKKAEAASRRWAEAVWKNNYECVGKSVPKGGLFNGDTWWGQGFMGQDWSDIKKERETDKAHAKWADEEQARFQAEEQKRWDEYDALVKEDERARQAA